MKEYIYKIAAKINHFESTGDIKREEFEGVLKSMYSFLQEMVKQKINVDKYQIL